jgi:putative glutamine amidotransferase
MTRPWIGLPTRYHEKSQYVGQLRHYLDAVLWAGGLPLLIPTVNDPEVLRAYARRIDGVLLPGSPTDIAPQLYGAEPHARLGKLCPERDTTDLTLLEESERADKPVLGICFGAQSLNVYRGGSLVQDIPSLVQNAVAHDNDDMADNPSEPTRHLVRLSEDSLLTRLAGNAEVEVNSYHHQAILRPGKDLRGVALAPDGVVEAVEDTRGRFIVGVQWHPERSFQTDPFAQALFKAFINSAFLRA